MISLTLGARRIDRVISNVDRLLRHYRKDIGYDYLEYELITPAKKLLQVF
jgi:hypothetical protein